MPWDGSAGGSLYTVGSNTEGQLGLGHSNAVVTWGKVSPVAGGWGAATITAMAAGKGHTVVLAGVHGQGLSCICPECTSIGSWPDRTPQRKVCWIQAIALISMKTGFQSLPPALFESRMSSRFAQIINPN